MVDPKWRNALQTELVRQGLPGDYSERLMDELLDHYLCLEEETASMDALQTASIEGRIGKPDEIAQTAGTEYRARSVFGRHPVLTFVIGPIPLLVLTWTLCGGIAALAFWGFGLFVGDDFSWTKSTVTPTVVTLLRVVYFLWALAPFVLSAWLLVRIARRSGRSAKWAFCACAIIGLFASTYESCTVLPIEPGTGKGIVAFGIPVLRGALFEPSTEAIQFSTRQSVIEAIIFTSAPFAVGVYFLWKTRNATHWPLAAGH